MSELISPAQLGECLNQPNTIILDCRSDLADATLGRAAYLQGHIPGAQFADLENDLSGEVVAGQTGRHPLPELAQLEQTIQHWGITQDSHVIAYDQANSMYAVRAWWLLKWSGVKRVQVLNGGLRHWQDTGGALQSDINQAQPSQFKLKPNKHWVCQAEQLNELPSDALLLDARAVERYQGLVEPIDSKSGHIPTAHNADFSKNLTTAGLFKSPAELAKRFEATIGRNVICYCGSGVTACHNILAITEAGYPMPKLYPGSWSEWITQPECKIATGIEGDLL